MATAKIQTRGFKTVVHKPMGDVKDATSIIYTIIYIIYIICTPHHLVGKNQSVSYLLTQTAAIHT